MTRKILEMYKIITIFFTRNNNKKTEIQRMKKYDMNYRKNQYRSENTLRKEFANSEKRNKTKWNKKIEFQVPHTSPSID